MWTFECTYWYFIHNGIEARFITRWHAAWHYGANSQKKVGKSVLIWKIVEPFFLELFYINYLMLYLMAKEKDNLCTCLQFSFKPGASTTLCTGMVQETISYYVNNLSNVYGLLFDASKAFNHVYYCKLIRTLLDKMLSPLYRRYLLNMYVNKKKKIRIRRETTNSSYFNVLNWRGKLFLQFWFVFTWIAC